MNDNESSVDRGEARQIMSFIGHASFDGKS